MLDHRCVSPCLGMRNILGGKNCKGKDLETAAHEWKVEGYGIMESRGPCDGKTRGAWIWWYNVIPAFRRPEQEDVES